PDDEDAAASGTHGFERLPAEPELARPADQPRLDAGKATLAAAGRRDAECRPGRHRLVLPFQLELVGVAPLEQAFDRAVRGLVDEHGARLGRRLEAGGDVHRVAEGRVLAPRAGADLPEDDHSRRSSNADAEAFGAPAAPHFPGVLLHLAHDAQRAANGALCVVLPRRRRAEEGEDAVAREVLDMAAKRLDLPDDAGPRLPHDELDVLGIE